MFEKYSESFLNNFDLLLEKFPDKKFITFKKDEILFCAFLFRKMR